MPARTSKQAERRNSAKKGQEEEPEATPQATGNFVERAKTLFVGSCLAQTAPKLQALLQDAGKAPEAKKEEPKEEPKKEEDGDNQTEEKENDENGAKEETNGNHKDDDGDSPTKMFNSLRARLTWWNVLGLGLPASGEDAWKAWMTLKELEIDFGPKSRRKGSPGLDRIQVNVNNHLPQYLHLLLALMMLRALLFRSWFACLPWLVGYQVLSLFVPLEGLPQLPQVPVEKCPANFRVVGAVALHALVWLFFVYEVVLCTYFFEKIPIVGLFAYHAYAVRPLE